MYMDQQGRLWTLVARKLSGEATSEELVELARYQQEHPESTYSLQVLTDLWNQRNVETDGEAAFQRHLTRMALRDAVTPIPDALRADRRRPRVSLDLLINYFK